MGGGAAHAGARRRRAAAAAAALRPRRRVPAPARLLPPQPAEHLHRQAHPGHARRGARARARTRRGAVRMRRYGEVLRVPHVAALIASTLLARFPIGINALALILYLREQTGSYAVAGVVAGGLAAGSGIGAPVQGRLVDRFGQRRGGVPPPVVPPPPPGSGGGVAPRAAPPAPPLAGA